MTRMTSKYKCRTKVRPPQTALGISVSASRPFRLQTFWLVLIWTIFTMAY